MIPLGKQFFSVNQLLANRQTLCIRTRTGSMSVAVNTSAACKRAVAIGASQAGVDGDFLDATPEKITQICI